MGAVGGIRDAYLALKYPGFRPPFLENPVEIQVGNFYLPHGMERTGSKNYIDFIERSLMSDTFGAARHVGVAVLEHGSNWTFKAALSSTSVEDLALKPTADLPVPVWVPSKSLGRDWRKPVLRYHRPRHLRADLVRGSLAAFRRVRTLSSSRQLNRGQRRSGDDAGRRHIRRKQYPKGKPARHARSFLRGLWRPRQSGDRRQMREEHARLRRRAATIYGPVSLQAEYMNAQYNRNANNILAANAVGLLSPGGSSLDYDGYYVSGMVFLTGESKAASYQVDNNSNGGSFRQIQIKHPLSEGGVGAFALTARYSEVNLNSGPLQGGYFFNAIALAPTQARKNVIYDTSVLGGREEDMTVGLNWYAEPGVRVMANWTRVLALSAPSSAPYYNGAHPNTFLVRTQVDW